MTLYDTKKLDFPAEKIMGNFILTILGRFSSDGGGDPVLKIYISNFVLFFYLLIFSNFHIFFQEVKLSKEVCHIYHFGVKPVNPIV